MSSSSGKKIVRKVFYTAGSAIGEVSKIKDELVDMAKSFQSSYHLLNHVSSPASKGNGQLKKPSGQQLDALYSHFGKIIYENIVDENLSFQFNPGHEYLQKQAEELLKGIFPKQEPEEQTVTVKEVPKEDEVSKTTETPLNEPTVPSEDSMIRLKGVVGLSRLNTAESRLALLSHAKDPDNLVRRVIVNCINPEGGQEETFAIVKFINDPDEDVARIAIRKSAKTRNRLAFTYLISRLDSANVKIRKEAIDALILITGSDLGFNPASGENARNEAVLRWQHVWQDNQMNPLFLVNDEATRAIVKKKYEQKPEEVEKKPKSKESVQKKIAMP